MEQSSFVSAAEQILATTVPFYRPIWKFCEYHFEHGQFWRFMLLIALAGLLYLYLHRDRFIRFSEIPLTYTTQIASDDEIYHSFMDWVGQHAILAKSRFSMAITGFKIPGLEHGKARERREAASRDFDTFWKADIKEQQVPGILYTPSADRAYLLVYKGRRFYFWRVISFTSTFTGMSRSETLYIRQFGSDSTPTKQLLSDIQEFNAQSFRKGTPIYRKSSDGSFWEFYSCRPRRSLNAVILDSILKNLIVQDIQDYLHPDRELWHQNRGMPYRRGYLFEGPPGTGKTSLCMALAGRFELPIYVLDLSSANLTEEGLTKLFSLIPYRCVLLIEDVDAVDAAWRRRSPGDQERQIKTAENRMISMSTLLNTIDGIAAKEGRILVMTTNHPENLDPALIRHGRIDMRLPFSHLTKALAMELFVFVYSAQENEPEGEQLSDLEDLAARFGAEITEGKFTAAEVQNYLVQKQNARKAVDDVMELVGESETLPHSGRRDVEEGLSAKELASRGK